MTLRDLLEDINKTVQEYGEEALDWDVYSEQCHEKDKEIKRTTQRWEICKDFEDWEYFKCVGGPAKWPEKKRYMITVNY